MDHAPHRIVIKLGTGLLTETGGTGLDVRQFRRLTYEIADLVQRGIQCIVVTSGAVGEFLRPLGQTKRHQPAPTAPLVTTIHWMPRCTRSAIS